MKRIFLIVLDSFGIGALPDAEEFGDLGANTLASCAKSPRSCTEVIAATVTDLLGVTFDTPGKSFAKEVLKWPPKN